MDITPQASAVSAAQNPISTFPDPMDPLYPPIDLEWQASFDMENFAGNTPSLVEGTMPWSPDEISLTTPSWTTDTKSGYFDFDPLQSDPDLMSDDNHIALDPAIFSMDTLTSPQPLQTRKPKSGNVLIRIDSSRPHTPRPDSDASSSMTTSDDSMSSRGCPIKWSTRMLSRGFETRASRSSGMPRKQLFRSWKKSTTPTSATNSPYQSSQEDVVKCSNCGFHMDVREAAQSSHQELVEMLIQQNPALAELAKQPNVRIEFELPTSTGRSTRHSPSADLEMEGQERELEDEPKYIIICSGDERTQNQTCSD